MPLTLKQASKLKAPRSARALGQKPDGAAARAKYFTRMDLLVLSAVQGLQDNPEVSKITAMEVAQVTGLPLADAKWRIMMLAKWTGPGPEQRSDRLTFPEGINLHNLWSDFGVYSGIPAPEEEEALKDIGEPTGGPSGL